METLKIKSTLSRALTNRLSLEKFATNSSQETKSLGASMKNKLCKELQAAGRESTLPLLVTQRTGERWVQAMTTAQKAATKVKNQSILSPLESFGEGERRLMRRREWQLKTREGMKSCSKQASSNSTRGAQQGSSCRHTCRARLELCQCNPHLKASGHPLVEALVFCSF